MNSVDPSASVDLDELHRLLKILTLISFTFTVIVIFGEVVGWWHDFGEFSAVIGVIATVMVGIVTLLVGATKSQVQLIATGVASSNAKLDSTNTKLDTANGKLDNIGEGVVSLRTDMNAGFDRQVAAIDRAHDEAEEQSALLEEHASLLAQQTVILAAIRDRLPPAA